MNDIFTASAAGMRTYGLVSMAAAAITLIAGYPAFWYGGHPILTSSDPTRVMQGIVTGVGFLGAGVIMKEGLNISGLTTAASIWVSSVVGILVGVGFYGAAIMLAVLAACCMIFISRLEKFLPSHHAVYVVLRFKNDFEPQREVLERVAKERGYQVAWGTLSIHFFDQQPEWHFQAISFNKSKCACISDLAEELANFQGVDKFDLSPARH